MNKRSFPRITLGIILLTACAPKAPSEGALILGQTSGLDPEDTFTAVLFRHDGDAGEGILTDTLRNGRFSFRLDTLPDADHYMVSFFRPHPGYIDVINSGPEIYLEPGTVVRIKGEAKYLRNARIDSPVRDQQLRQRYLKKMSREDWDALDEIQAHRYRIINELYYSEGLTPVQTDSLRKAAQQDLDASHEINDRLFLQDLKILETEEIGTYALDRIQSLAHQVSSGKKEYREAVLRLYERLSDEQKTSREGMEALNYLNPVKTVTYGSPVPAYEYIDKEGKTVRVSDFAGKWVLLDFWSKGCGPCIRSVPELGALSQEFLGTLAVVSISLDKERAWREASQEHGITWNDWNDPKGTSGSVRAYGTNGIPTFILVSPDGTIQQIIVGYREGLLRRTIQSALST